MKNFTLSKLKITNFIFAILLLSMNCEDYGGGILCPLPRKISLSQTSINFNATESGGNPSPQSVEITRDGDEEVSELSATVKYTNGSSGWLSASLNQATTPATLTLQPTTGNLGSRSHSASVEIASKQAKNSPLSIGVTLNVISRPAYTLTINIDPPNAGSVSKDVNQNNYTLGTTVTLTATPNSSSRFRHWSGNALGTENQVTVTINENKSVTANFANFRTPELRGPVSSAPDRKFELSWTHNWPIVVSSSDHYILEESTVSATTGFSVILRTPFNDRSSPYYFYLTKSNGLYYYRVRAFEGHGYSNYSNVIAVNVTNAPAQLKIINDLYDGISDLRNDWKKLNNVVRVRISHVANLSNTDDLFERLETRDDASSPGNMIEPRYNSDTNYKVFDVSEYNRSWYYIVYIQTGWWEYFYNPDTGNSSWLKRFSDVLCANTACCCPKETIIFINGHQSGIHEIKLSQYLPHGNFDGTY